MGDKSLSVKPEDEKPEDHNQLEHACHTREIHTRILVAEEMVQLFRIARRKLAPIVVQKEDYEQRCQSAIDTLRS